MTENENGGPGNDGLLALVKEVQQVQRAMVEREAELRREIAELRATVARLTRGPAEPHAAPADVPATADGADTGLSRRRLMRMVGTGAAVGAAAVGATVAGATPAAAAPNNPLVIGASNDGATTITSLTSSPTPDSSTFAAINNATDRPIGLYGVAGPVSGLPVSGGGVVGNSQDQNGVVGFSANGDGLSGRSTNGVGAYAYSQSGVGVFAQSYNSWAVYALALYGSAVTGGAAVKAYAQYNPGVLAESSTTHGVVGLAQSASLASFTTSGLLGQATSARGVTGAATSGTGVVGQAGTGVGVQGISTSTGVAAQFSGGRAQLYLVPAATTGAPTSGTHKIGELFLDQTGGLYVCKTAGTPGTWKLLG